MMKFAAYGLPAAALILMTLVTVLPPILQKYENIGDLGILHEAGAMWLRGEDPYTAGVRGSSFAYPPTAALPLMMFSLVPWQYAQTIFLLLNLGALIGILHFTVKILAPTFSWRELTPLQGLIFALLIFNPVNIGLFQLSQTSLLVLFFSTAAWYFHLQNKWILTAVFLALGAMKPQYVLLPGLWILLRKDFRSVFGAAAAAVLLFLPLVFFQEALSVFPRWFSALGGYGNYDFNTLGHQDVIGLQSFLAAFGVMSPTLLPVMGALFLVLYLKRDSLAAFWHFPLLMALSFTFFFAHEYDLVAMIPLWLGLLCSRNKFAWILYVLFLIPVRFFRELTGTDIHSMHPLLHWRTIVILAAGLLTVFSLGIAKKEAPNEKV